MLKKTKNWGHISGWQIFLTLLITTLTTAAVEGATGTVNYNTVYQQLEGFGGAAVYDCPNLTTHTKKDEIYNLLFRDLGIEILRIRNTYGYSDSGANLAATAAIIAVARDPNHTPNLKIELVPWSPPSYLKSNGNENSGGTLAKSGGVYVYNAYADWWYNSLLAWEANGVVPDFISIQNEPDCFTNYDSCRFNPTEADANAGYDQAFQAVYNKLNTEMGSSKPKMWAPCTMGIVNSQAYIDALNAIGQMGHIDGFSHHLYSDGNWYDTPDNFIPVMQSYKTNYGDYYGKPLNMTEYVKLSTTPNFDMAWKFAWHIYNCLYYEHVNSYFNWTLFRYGSSSSGGIVTMDSSSTYIIRPQYWYVKAYAHFTGKDWYVLNTSVGGMGSGGLRMSAFKDPDGDQLTVVILNTSSSTSLTSLTLNGFTPCGSEVYQSYQDNYWVSLGAFSGSLTLPAYSITTIHMARADSLESDLNGDCYVNYKDLKIIADNWLRTDCTEPTNCGGADFEPTDRTVDLFDFSDFASQWLWCNNPIDPNCVK